MTTTETTTILKAVAEALYRQAGYVPFLWHIDDVRVVNQDREFFLDLTDAECLEVLTNARDNVPADIGMSFDAIEVELECVAEIRRARKERPPSSSRSCSSRPSAITASGEASPSSRA